MRFSSELPHAVNARLFDPLDLVDLDEHVAILTRTT
jgi:hypothetical protein